MKLLLDTHVFLWWNMDAPELSATARSVIADHGNQVYLSAVSAWEIVIKVAKGRLVLPEPPQQYVLSRITANRMQGLPIEISHTLEVSRLPDHHSDPFDRMLIAQSRVEALGFICADPGYGAVWSRDHLVGALKGSS